VRIALAAAILSIPLLLSGQESTASLAGGLTDVTGAYIVGVPVQLDSGTMQYQARTNESGVYRFSNLQAGSYTLTFRVVGFKLLIVKLIEIREHEQKQLPDVPLEVEHGLCPRPIAQDQVLLPPGSSFGSLIGSVTPAIAEVEVTLVCRTFTACRSTQTDSNGHFSFDMLSPGAYGLSFRRDGFYPENATGYEYHVNAGWESVYSPAQLDPCLNGNCDPKLRPKRRVEICE
jgi:Carboxypeptidase regulatory-like domain